MTQHSGVLKIERTISARQAAPIATDPPVVLHAAPEAKLHAVPAPEVRPLVESQPKVAPQQAGGAKGLLRRLLVASAGVLALAAAGHFCWHYWTIGRFKVATDDAYVRADDTIIAPKVAGYIEDVLAWISSPWKSRLVGDNEPVKAGQVLARIDDRDFKVAFEQTKADVAAANATIANKQAALDAQQFVIEAARATIVADRATQTFAEQEDKRYADLAAKGYGSVQNAQQAASRNAAARASVARDTATLASAEKQLEVSKAELVQAEAALARAKAAQDQAELNLSYTTIVSPIDGVIGNRTLRVGQYVQAGTQLMAVVPTHAAYIVANYKETQLTNVRPGQPVAIKVDMFPGQVFRGRVDSLSPASGQEFALLPPDNATGNFTKVVQRIPVKIILDAGSSLAVVLRPGMSVYPKIDTKFGERRIAAAPVSKG